MMTLRYSSSLLHLRLASTFSVGGGNALGNASPRPFKEMPTEKGNSLLLGVSPELMKKDLDQIDFYRSLAEKHGKLFRVKVAPGKYLVILSDVDGIEFVQKNEGKYPVRGDIFRPFKILIMASEYKDHLSTISGLAPSDGPEWARSRSELNQVLMPRKLARQVKRLDPVSQTFLEIVQESVDKDGYSRDCLEFLPFWALECMLRFTYPQDLDVQRSKDQRAVDIYEGVEDVLNTVKLQHYPTWVLKYLPLKAMKKGREGLRRYKSAAMEYINEVESKGIPTSEDPAEGTIYEQLKAKGMPIESIVVIISDFVTGGAGTTVQIMASTLQQLAQHPEVQKKAHDEVVSVAGKDGVITDEVMQKLSYIKAIQKETARFTGLTGVVTARVLDKELLLGGYRIPEKTLILFNTSAMKSDPTIFPNPEEFRPERWLRDGENDKMMKVQQIAASIFGYGPRSCIGRRQSEFIMWSLLAKIMQKTEIELHPDSEGMRPIGQSFMVVDKPLKLKLTPVKS